MKKNLYLLASAALLSFASCTDEMKELESQQPQLLKQIVMTTEDFQPETSSRTLYEIADGAVKCTWAADDTVGVFPDEGAQAYFPMASGKGTKNATFDGGGWALKDGRTYGAYYPFITDILLDRNAVPVDYTGQTQTGNGSMAHLGDYDYMVAPATTSEFGSANFMFKHLSALVQLKLTVPRPATITSVKLVAETKAFAAEGKVDIMADSVYITPVNPTNEMELVLEDVTTTEENQVITLYMMLPPADLSEQTLKAVIVSDKGTQEIHLESKNFQAGTTYALSGELEYKEDEGIDKGTVTLNTAGTLVALLGDDCLNIASLKLVGPINGDDVRCLRQMLGGNEFSESERGKLSTLDLSEASIVEGGSWYYAPYSSGYYTSNNVIGDYMFYGCKKLQKIILPQYATLIRSSAFSSCSALASVLIHNNIRYIGGYAFYDCVSLKSITIPESVESIDSYAFYGCSSLASITIPNSITSIGSNVFEKCSSLTSIILPNRITVIQGMTFKDCQSLASITIPNSVVEIRAYAFEGCTSLTSISIPNSVISIQFYAFYKCSSLSSVILGNRINSIGYGAFLDTSITQCYCYATTPPVLEYTPMYNQLPFYDVKEEGILYVPSGYSATYKATEWGDCFKIIQEIK